MKISGIRQATAVRGTLFFLLAATACAQKIQTGYDKSVDFSQYKTYAWIPRATPAANPALAAIIHHNIGYELEQKGLREVDGNPDLLVQSYGGAGEVEGGYAAGPGYTGTGGYLMPGTTMWGGSLPETPSPQIMHGTITVDLIDARHKRIVWRATAKGKMDYNKRSKLLEQSNKAILEMFKKYPPPK
jgi:hypothetical protein